MFGGSGHLFYFFLFFYIFQRFASSFGERAKLSVANPLYLRRAKIFRKMLEFQTLAMLLCATGVLTSSVSGTDASRNETHVDVKNLQISPSVSSATEPPRKLSNDNAHLIMGEGGPIYRSTQRPDFPRGDKSSPTSTVVAEGIKITSKDLVPTDSESGGLKIRNPSVVPRKGVVPPSKIAARKGVGPESLAQNESTVEVVDKTPSRVAPAVDNTEKKKIDLDGGKKITPVPKGSLDRDSVAIPAVSKNASDIPHLGNKTAMTPGPANATPTVETKLQNSTISPSSTTRKFKPKPTVTIGEMDIDKPIPASPTKTPPLGMPRKIDYIVPVIITIMALPLLGGAAFFLYRRGRDCWDKRHYRRMDFLIDGMYNDHTSWK